jgi:alanine racemase
VRVSREQIVSNYQAVRQVVGSEIEVLAVVKAGAYGHGALEVSRALHEAGAPWLAVATVREGIALRAGGIGCRILVMGGCLAGEYDAIVENALTPALHSLEDIAVLEATARTVAFHLKVDTGMGRMGTCAPAEAIVGALKSLKYTRCEGLMSHLASATAFDSSQSERQIACFEEILSALESAGIAPEYTHMASTSAIAYPRPRSWGNLVRVGLGLYGYVSKPRGNAPPSALEVRPALEWKARLLAVKDLPAGAPVGYDATYLTPRAMRIGIVCAGYADGVFHSLSNKGRLIAAGRFAPFVGSVSMDVTTVDLSDATGVRPGDEVTLLGREGEVALDAQQIAETAGTISYSVLCNISPRVERVYV